jgi:catechol 2,3-dioxygenase-like lactoylglutathione lyase family enzyme
MTRLVAAEPQVFAIDLPASLAYFVERLGFTIVFRHGDPIHYAQVGRDGVQINLRAVDQMPFGAAFRAQVPDALAAVITVTDATRMFAEFQSRGAHFHQTLRVEPWGAHTFIVADPDGQLLLFAGDAAP